jgi:hypothetical protein
MTDKDVERELPTLEQVHAFLLGTAPIDGLWFGDADSGRPYWWRKFLRAAIAVYESAVTDATKLGTVSLTSFGGHCVRIDFPNREDAERMYAVLTKGSE